MNPVVITLIVAILAGGGVSIAAEGTEPGHFLYAVKTNINEEVRDFFAVSAEADARHDSNVVLRRIKEAEELAVRGKLTAETATALQGKIGDHTVAVLNHTESLMSEATGISAAANILAQLEGSLRAHTNVLESMEANADGEVQVGLNTMLSVVRGSIGVVQRARVDAEGNFEAVLSEGGADLEAAVESRVDDVRKRIDRVSSRIENRRGDLRNEAIARVRTNLTRADRALSNAESRLDGGDRMRALQELQVALRHTQEAEVLTNVDLSLKLKGMIDAGTIFGGTASSQEERDRESQEGEEQNREGEEATSPETRVESQSETRVEVEAGANAGTGSEAEAESRTEVEGEGSVEINF